MSNTELKGNILLDGVVKYQGAFHVVNPEDLRREIKLLFGVAAYSLLPWRGGATLFCFTRRKCWRASIIYNHYKWFYTRLLMSFWHLLPIEIIVKATLSFLAESPTFSSSEFLAYFFSLACAFFGVKRRWPFLIFSPVNITRQRDFIQSTKWWQKFEKSEKVEKGTYYILVCF